MGSIRPYPMADRSPHLYTGWSHTLSALVIAVPSELSLAEDSAPADCRKLSGQKATLIM